MRFIVNHGKVFTFLLILFPLLGISASYLFLQYQETKREIVSIVKDSMVTKKHELLDIYTNYLSAEYGENFIQVLKDNPQKRINAEKSLSLMQNSEVQYIYLLYIDKKNRLRYLLDTTKDIDERGEYKQRFIPQKTIWKKAQKEQTAEITAQNEIDKLWITMVYPIIVDEKVLALLGIDFSHKEHIAVNKTLLPLEHIYLYSAIFIIVMLISAFIQLLIYYTHRKKSFIDPLTQMFNRQYLYELLTKFNVSDFHVVIMDLDHFKHVNDTYGHDAGDRVLREVALRMRNMIRKQDILIRYGGEEFILLVETNDLSVSTDIAERIREEVKASPIDTDECQLDITISMGLNPHPADSKSFDEAVKIADEGLYKAKQLGRDRVEVYDPHVRSENTNQQKMCDVKDALDNNKVFCYYQAIFDTQSLEIKGYELLVRMYNKEGELIEPKNFLPSISNTQVYIHLTQKMIDIAYNTLLKKDINISINMGIQDILNDEVIGLLLEKFSKKSGLGSRLSIEILENDEIVEYEYIKQRLATLQALGIKISIDDFGRGFANYTYLLNLNVDSIKLDASLINGVDTNIYAREIIRSIVYFATNIGIEVIAEHVSNLEEFECLKALDVEFVQGFYLAQPTMNIE